MNPRPFSIAVIGAGLSGALLAVHLLRHCRPGDRVYLIEKRAGFGLGLAYPTTNQQHLLNVRAGNMSAFHDQPNHFVDWLRSRAPDDEPAPTAESFVSRRLYGTYVRSVLCDELWANGKGRNLYPGTRPGGGAERRPRCVSLTVAGGRCYRVDGVVLAAGNQSADESKGAYFGESVASGRDDRRAAQGPGAVDRHRADDGRHRPVASGRRSQGHNPRSVAARVAAARARAGASPRYRRRRPAENDVGFSARPLAARHGSRRRGTRVRMARGHRRPPSACAGSVAAAADRGAPPIFASLTPVVGDPPASHRAERSGHAGSSYATRATRRRRGQDRRHRSRREFGAGARAPARLDFDREPGSMPGRSTARARRSNTRRPAIR